jgi:hypothetical protein
MNELHPALEKLLAALGISTTQIRWRCYRQRDALRAQLASMQQTRARHKFCHHCGHLAAVGAIAAHAMVYDPQTLTAGASGIAFGLIGFGVAYFHRTRNHAQRRFFLQWFAYGLVFGFLMRANHAAHLGGFLTGLPLGYLAAGMRVRHQGVWRAAGILCLAVWIACLGFLARNIARNRRALIPTVAAEPSIPPLSSAMAAQG